MKLKASCQKILACVTLLVMVVGLSIAAATTVNAEETRLERAKRTGRALRIGFSQAPPFSFSTPDGRYTGEELEIAKLVLQKLGIKVEFIVSEFSALIPGLYSDRLDINGAGPYITPTRCEQVIFSQPTYKLGAAFLVQAGNPKNLHSYEDVAKNPEVKVAILAGAAEQGYARKAGIPESQIMTVNSSPDQLEAVKSGRADAGAQSALAIQDQAVKGGPKVERASPFHTPSYAISYGSFAFRKEDKDLRDAFNAFLKDFMGTKEHLALIKPFGFTEAELPGDKTTAELCAAK